MAGGGNRLGVNELGIGQNHLYFSTHSVISQSYVLSKIYILFDFDPLRDGVLDTEHCSYHSSRAWTAVVTCTVGVVFGKQIDCNSDKEMSAPSPSTPTSRTVTPDSGGIEKTRH